MIVVRSLILKKFLVLHRPRPTFLCDLSAARTGLNFYCSVCSFVFILGRFTRAKSIAGSCLTSTESLFVRKIANVQFSLHRIGEKENARNIQRPLGLCCV